jgi:hypothetical protein
MKNKLNYLFLVLAAASVLAVGCKKEDTTPAAPAMPDKTNMPAPPK